MATEVELKLYCPLGEICRIESHPLIASGYQQGASKRLDNTYFDTPDLSLHGKRMALRVRSTPTQQLQTVKCAAESVAGLSSRPEWETEYVGSFDFKAIDNLKIRHFLKEQEAKLVPVFTTSFERKTWKVDLSRKTSILIMIDSGVISSGDKVLPISEIELELAQGSPDDLLAFAAALANDLPLFPDNVSKAEKGYQLFLNQAPIAARATTSRITPKQTSAEAFHELAQQGMLMWQTNQLGILTANSPDFVHQFRVSLRRLGSLLKIFKPVLPERFHGHWTNQLKSLAKVTGEIRNLDVMRESVLQPISLANTPHVANSAKEAITACEIAQQDALLQIQHLQYGGPALQFANDLRKLPTDVFAKNLPRFAENRLSSLHGKARKRLRKALKQTTPENAHQLRIALKHLRYSCEFFAPLFDEDLMLEYAKAMANLQDELGFVNDVHVALVRLQDWIDTQEIREETRECVATWHMPQVEETLKRALPHAELALSNCLPWCSECDRRGMLSRRRESN